jgi:hypothetical protein
MQLQEKTIPSARAQALILKGMARSGMRVSGHLDLSGRNDRIRMPAFLCANSIDLSACPHLSRLPAHLIVDHLNLNGCIGLAGLPSSLRCDILEMQGSGIRTLPEDLRVRFLLDLQDCKRLEILPRRLSVQTLLLRRCTALTRLPNTLDVCRLALSGCTALVDWPEPSHVRISRLDLAGCVSLRGLPKSLGTLSELNMSGCTQIRTLPQGMKITGWLDLTDSGVTSLPDSLHGVRLRWRGVFVDERIVFRPGTITAGEILAETNVERRRVMLERMGYERFFREARAEVLDADLDRGGERRLLRVPMPWDEDLVCVAVCCPSTGRQFLLRVPPATTTCNQAAAWIAGFDDPAEYQPIIET